MDLGNLGILHFRSSFYRWDSGVERVSRRSEVVLRGK